MQGYSEATHGHTNGTTRFRASNRSMMQYPTVTQVVRHVTGAGTIVPWDFENSKIEHISDCWAPARWRMVKRMVRRDSALEIGL